MLTTTEKTFTIFFSFIVIAELICGSIDALAPLHFITKPLIVVSLIVFFWKEANSISKSIRRLTMLALAFSLLGDVLLMFVDQSTHYFMFGLVAFLLAHLMYIVVFLKERNPKKLPMVIFIAFLIIGYGLFSLLKDHLADMFIPVIIYMLVILTMVNTSFLREGKVPKMSFRLVCFGAILFLISDGILAIDKFYSPIALANIFIMLTYAFAQYFIVLGLKKQS